MFRWSAPWINGWVNHRETGDLRGYRAHYDITVMSALFWTGLGGFLCTSRPGINVHSNRGYPHWLPCRLIGQRNWERHPRQNVPAAEYWLPLSYTHTGADHNTHIQRWNCHKVNCACFCLFFIYIKSHHIQVIESAWYMMTSWNGNIFRVTGHLCGEFTGPRWIPHTKASDAELWCFLWSASEWTVE